jgi:hypothetical protein
LAAGRFTYTRSYFKEGIAEIYNLTGQAEKAKIAEEILNYMKISHQ